jgi:glycine dehydrogenase subunit 1
VHPSWRKVVRTIVRNQGIEVIEVPYDTGAGSTSLEALGRGAGNDLAAVVIPQPNFFGVLEPVDELADWAHANGALAIAAVNPTALALLKPPGEWGARGADIAVGDGQPLGAPLAGGGPYFGFMTCRKDLVRQMPGRIVGATLDREGRRGYVLTLQAREQHIRRAKATSNICTNQGLIATAATLYLALLGPTGLADVARACHANTLALVSRLIRIRGIARAFSGAIFHEAVLRLPVPVAPVLRAMRAQRILGGCDLTQDYPELGHALLVCATETRTSDDIARYGAQLERVIDRPPRPAAGAAAPMT